MLKANLISISKQSFSLLKYALLAAVLLACPDASLSQELKLKLDLTPPPRDLKELGLDPAANPISITPGKPSGNTTKPSGIELPAQKKASEDELKQLTEDLSSADFQVRKAASDRLKTLTTEDMGKVAYRLMNSPSAEALVRVHAELAKRYQAESKAERLQASELLETKAVQPRLISADPATYSLDKHWEQRIEVAFTELQEMGAIVKNGNFSIPDGSRGFGDPRPANQILMTKSWKGGDAGLEVFRRLEALTGPIRSLKGINVYLLSGHPLTPDQEKQLISIVGANRVQYRSVVALGITADRMTQGLFDGILIRGVSAGGSAQKAGLEPGDFLLSMSGPDEESRPIKYNPESWKTFRRPLAIPPGEEKPAEDAADPDKNPQRLVDFDELVERLKEYQPGDKVKLQVVKQFRAVQMFRPFPVIPPGDAPGDENRRKANQQKVIEVEVELIGWADLPMVR